MQVRSLRAGLLALVLLTACGTPPHKEMDQAQGAIDTARAAGADRYAADEYKAAVDALRLANEAVDQRDYRLALNHALESREQAQNSARTAAASRARVRADVERANIEITTMLAQAQGRLTTAEKNRAARRAVVDARRAIDQARGDVQKAGAATQAEDYVAAQNALSTAKARLTKVIETLDAALGTQSSKRRP